MLEGSGSCPGLASLPKAGGGGSWGELRAPLEGAEGVVTLSPEDLPQARGCDRPFSSPPCPLRPQRCDFLKFIFNFSCSSNIMLVAGIQHLYIL